MEIGLRHADFRQVAVNALQVALADQRGLIAGLAHDIDERRRRERQRYAVLPGAVERRHAPGHKRRAIGHADRRGNVKIFKPRAGLREVIDMRRFYDGVAVAAQMIGSVLIGDDEEKIRS